MAGQRKSKLYKKRIAHVGFLKSSRDTKLIAVAGNAISLP